MVATSFKRVLACFIHALEIFPIFASLNDTPPSHLQFFDCLSTHPLTSCRPRLALQPPAPRTDRLASSLIFHIFDFVAQLSQLCLFGPLGFVRQRMVVSITPTTTTPTKCVHFFLTKPANAFHETLVECRFCISDTWLLTTRRSPNNIDSTNVSGLP